MSDSFLRYTALASAIQLARANGLTTSEIVRALTGSMSYADALKIARRAAPILEITVPEFLRLRKND